MENKYGSAFVRIPFQYDGADRDQLNFLRLLVQYDDGFAAYLNGVRLAAANVPTDPRWTPWQPRRTRMRRRCCSRSSRSTTACRR